MSTSASSGMRGVKGTEYLLELIHDNPDYCIISSLKQLYVRFSKSLSCSFEISLYVAQNCDSTSPPRSRASGKHWNPFSALDYLRKCRRRSKEVKEIKDVQMLPFATYSSYFCILRRVLFLRGINF